MDKTLLRTRLAVATLRGRTVEQALRCLRAAEQAGTEVDLLAMMTEGQMAATRPNLPQRPLLRKHPRRQRVTEEVVMTDQG